MVADDEYSSVKDALRDTWISNYVDTYSSPSMAASYRNAANDILRMNDNDMAIIQEVMAGMAIRNYADAEAFYDDILTPVAGFDGFWTKWGNENLGVENNVILALRSSQVKYADPVTYDDAGNIIPLSERFTRSETDIRYSQRLPDDISTREYLADADSSIAANAEQANALEIYKTRIAAYREATQAVDQAKAALATTTDRDESIKARNRLELLQKQQSRADDQLIAAEDTNSDSLADASLLSSSSSPARPRRTSPA